MVLANGIPQHERDVISLWIVLLLSVFLVNLSSV